MEFKIGDKVKIDFEKVLKSNGEELMTLRAMSLNKDKIFTIARIPDNGYAVLTEAIEPFSKYIPKQYLISIKGVRKDKLNKINESYLRK